MWYRQYRMYKVDSNLDDTEMKKMCKVDDNLDDTDKK